MWRIEGVMGLLLGGLVTVVMLMRRKRQGAQARRFPWEPFGWPLIGHLHLFFLSPLPHRTLAAIAQKHGHHVIGLRLGLRRALVVCSPDSAKQVLLTHDKLFAHRPPLQFNSLLLFGSPHGPIFGGLSPEWSHNRKICLRSLFTPKRLQALQYVRQQEMRALLLSLHQQSCAGSTPIHLGTCVGQMSSRLIMRLVQSKATVQVGEENLQQLVSESEQEVAPTVGDLIPFLSWLDFFRKRRMHLIHARIDKVYEEILMERQASTSIHDDLLQSLLSQEEALSIADIKTILHEITSAGIHTTTLTLEWAMAELLRNPRCLHRLQREIDMQVGDEKKEVTDADLPSLSYLKCVVKEVLRLHPVIPLLVPRISAEDCKLQGYTIPAKTVVFVNVWAIGRDERVWPNANEFMPERFEGTDIDVKGQQFELLPFGSGRRTCLGLPLALAVVEATLANLVSSFDWELPHGETRTSLNMDEKGGIALNRATPLMVIPKPRSLSGKE